MRLALDPVANLGLALGEIALRLADLLLATDLRLLAGLLLADPWFLAGLRPDDIALAALCRLLPFHRCIAPAGLLVPVSAPSFGGLLRRGLV